MTTDSSRSPGHVLFHPPVCVVQKEEGVASNPTSLNKIMVEVPILRRDLIKSKLKELGLKSLTPKSQH